MDAIGAHDTHLSEQTEDARGSRNTYSRRCLDDLSAKTVYLNFDPCVIFMSLSLPFIMVLIAFGFK